MEEAWISAGSMIMFALLARSSVEAGAGEKKEVKEEQAQGNICFIR